MSRSSLPSRTPPRREPRETPRRSAVVEGLARLFLAIVSVSVHFVDPVSVVVASDRLLASFLVSDQHHRVADQLASLHYEFDVQAHRHAEQEVELDARHGCKVLTASAMVPVT